jgi:hypothetical protein
MIGLGTKVRIKEGASQSWEPPRDAEIGVVVEIGPRIVFNGMLYLICFTIGTDEKNEFWYSQDEFDILEENNLS